MMSSSTEDLTELVRRIVETESTLYRQKHAWSQARRELEIHRPVPNFDASSMAIPFYPSDAPLNYHGLTISLVCLAVSLAVLLFGNWRLEITIGAASFLTAAVVVYLMYFRVKYSREQAKLQRREELEKLRQELEQEHSKRESRFRQVSGMLDDAFNMAIAETESSLDELYASACIAPEHRDLASMCSLYEQLLSGHRPNVRSFHARKPADDLDSLLNAPESIEQSHPTLSRELQKVKQAGEQVPHAIHRLLTGDEELPIESIIPTAE